MFLDVKERVQLLVRRADLGLAQTDYLFIYLVVILM